MSRMVKLDDVLDIINSALESYEDSLEYVNASLEVAAIGELTEDAYILGIERERINACIMELRECIAEVKAL